MAQPTNPSFETAGANPGEANAWTDTQSTSAEDIAVFDTAASGDRPLEDFETQFQEPQTLLATYNEDSITEFSPSDLSSAVFDGAAQVETFEAQYLEPMTGSGPPYNQHSITVFDSSNLDTAMFDSGAEGFEDFEEGWIEPETSGTQSASHKYDDAPDANTPPPALVTSSAAMFNSGSNAEENFDNTVGWGSSNAATPSATTAALFDGGTNAYEDYNTWTSQMVY